MMFLNTISLVLLPCLVNIIVTAEEFDVKTLDGYEAFKDTWQINVIKGE